MCERETAIAAVDLFKKLLSYQERKIRSYLRVEINKKMIKLNGYLEGLKKVEGEEKSDILYTVIKEIELHSEQIKELSNELDKPFMLFSVGMGKFGKSTLINALLGCRVAEVGVVPKTWKIDIFEKRETDNIVICFKNGEPQNSTLEETKKFLSEEEIKREESEKKIYRLLKNEKDKTKNTAEIEEIKKFFEKKYLYKSPVTEVRWPVRNSIFLNNFRVVDTPGLVQETMGELKLSLNEYYHKADGVLWMLDANKISAQNSKQLMDDLNKALSVIGGKANNIIAVLNFIDRVRKNHGEDAVNKVISEAKRIYKNMFLDIIPISAKEALDGEEQNNNELINKSGINQLMDAINNKFLNKAQKMQIESKLLGLKGINNEMLKSLNDYKERITRDDSRRQSISKTFQEELQRKRQEYIGSLTDFISKYTYETNQRIEEYTINLFEEGLDDKSRMIYVKNTIFKIDEFSNSFEVKQRDAIVGLKTFVDYHRKNSIFSEYKYINVYDNYKIDSDDSKMSVPQMNYDNFDTDNWSFGTNAGVIALSTIILGPIGLILSGLMSGFGFGRWIARKIKSYDVKENLKKSLYESTAKIKKDLDETINKLFRDGENIVNNAREDSFKRLYGKASYVDYQLEIIGEIDRLIKLEIEPLTVGHMVLKKLN